jgi:hypothetical protein
MSLINDALKRARDSKRNQPPPGAPPLQPVEAPACGSTRWLLVVAAILFLGAAGFILGPASFGHKPSPALAVKKIEIPAPPPAAAATAPVVNAAPAVTNVNPPTVAVENPPPAAKTNLPAAAVVVEKWPKVQGIVFNTAQPLAVVNGQTITVGERVGEFQVKQITQNSVVLQRPDGTQKTLGIGD